MCLLEWLHWNKLRWLVSISTSFQEFSGIDEHDKQGAGSSPVWPIALRSFFSRLFSPTPHNDRYATVLSTVSNTNKV